MSEFGPDDLTQLRVMHNTLPPTEGDTAYDAWPVGLVAGQNITGSNARQAATGVDVAQFQWCHRASRNLDGSGTRPNPITPQIRNSSDIQCRTEYTTVEKAVGAVLVGVMWSFGATRAEYEASAIAAGFDTSDIILYADAAANPDTTFPNNPDEGATPPYTADTFVVSRDKIILANARIVDGLSTPWGLVLDYEAQDGRSPFQTLDQIQDLSAFLSGANLNFSIYTNPLDGAVASANGFSRENLHQIMAVVDQFSILVGTKFSEPNAYSSCLAQLDTLTGPNGDVAVDHSKIYVTMALSGDLPEALQTAAQVRRLVTDATDIRASWFWPDLVRLGGEQANRMIGAVAFDYGTPKPVARRR